MNTPIDSSDTLTLSPVPRKRGRPRKILTPEEQAQLEYQNQHKRNRGRPRKENPDPEPISSAPKKRGRPKKVPSTAPEDTPTTPKHRGKPRKILTEEEIKASSTPKQRGRPKKESNPSDPFTVDYFHFPTPAQGGVRKGKYFLPTATILLRYLPYALSNPVILTPKLLLQSLGMVNGNYNIAQYTTSTNEYLKSKEYSQERRWFFQKSYLRITLILERELKLLEELQAIRFTKEILICTEDQDSHLATQEQKEDIEEAEQEVLDAMNIASTSEVMLRGLSHRFYSSVSAILHEDYPEYEIDKYFTCYVIDILAEYDPISQEEYKAWAQHMNELIQAAFRKYINTFYQNELLRESRTANAGEDTHYYKQNFVEVENALTDLLIKI